MSSAIVPIKPQEWDGKTAWKVRGGVMFLERCPSDLVWFPPHQGSPDVLYRETTPSNDVLEGIVLRCLAEDLKDEGLGIQMYFQPVIHLFLAGLGILDKYAMERFERRYEMAYSKRPGGVLPHKLADRPEFFAEAELWEAVYMALEAINRSGAWNFNWPTMHPAHALAAMVQERLLVGFCKGDVGELSADAYFRHHRSITQKLRDVSNVDNPFPEGSVTRAFVEVCDSLRDLSSKQGNFKGKYWVPLIAARTRLINIYVKLNPKRMKSDTSLPCDSRAKFASKRRRGRPKKLNNG
jgi:hypothetical protein